MDFMATAASVSEGIKIIKDFMTTILNLKIDSATKEKIRENMERLGTMQDQLFKLRGDLDKLQQENHELRKKLRDKEDWEAKLREYSLVTTEGGATVYCSNSEPKHFACPSCVNKEQIQPLQNKRGSAGIFVCPSCGHSFPVTPKKPWPLTSTGT